MIIRFHLVYYKLHVVDLFICGLSENIISYKAHLSSFARMSSDLSLIHHHYCSRLAPFFLLLKSQIVRHKIETLREPTLAVL